MVIGQVSKMLLNENLFETLNEEVVVKPTDNGYHDLWYLDDRYAVHNDGGIFHVIDEANGNNYLLNSDSIDEVNDYIKNTLNLDMSIEPSNRQFKKKANIDTNKDRYLRDAAEMDWESGHPYDPDDFSYFKRVCKEDGYNVNEEDFQKYWEYFDECRSKQFADEDDDSDNGLGPWEEMYSKQVEDSDGFMTDYTWYVKDNDDGSETHVMIFGDQDLYTPLNSEPDAEFDNEQSAQEWFDNYKGFAENLDESLYMDDEDEIYNGYVVRKSDTSDNYFVYDNNGHVEDDEHKGQGYPTKEEAIDRANSLEKGIAKSNSDLEEAIKPNIESEELKALAEKHNIKILDAMSNGDLRMEGAGADLMKFYQEAEKLGLWEVDPELYEALHGKEEINEFTSLAKKLGFTTMAQMQHIMNAAKSLGKSELEMLKSVDETFDGKIPDTLIDGLTDEFLIIAEDIGIETQEDYERFCDEEVEPGETITQAIKRYRDEIKDIDENLLTEIAILNVNEPAIFDAISNAKAYIHEKKYSQAKDSLNYAANLLIEPMNESAMSNLDLEIKEAGGKKNWKEKVRKELADMIEHLEYLKTYAPKEINAGGNYDSIEELQDDIEDLEKSINDLNSKLDYVDSVTSDSDD